MLGRKKHKNHKAGFVPFRGRVFCPFAASVPIFEGVIQFGMSTG
jgi:hypothetical protein